jgi:DNA-binding IclR family transcriptional regulator
MSRTGRVFHQRELTALELKRIQGMFEEGISVTQIAERMRVPKQQIYRLLRQFTDSGLIPIR